MLAKMWLMTHHPLEYTNSDGTTTFSQGIRDRLFVTSVEVIEFACLLENNENTAKWGWLFRTYMQWHAVAFVLSELCVREPGPDYERAWNAVESVYDERVSNPKGHKGMLWKPMRQLMIKAKAIRARHLRNGNASIASATGASMGRKPSMPWQQQFIGLDERILQTPGSSVPVHMEAFGMSFDESAMTESTAAAAAAAAQLPLNMSQQQMDQTPVQRNFSDEDISQWLAQEQLQQQNPESFNWSGWNLGTLDIGDVPMTTEPFNQYPAAGGLQEWF